jgi:hypothetical protein
VLRAGWRWAAVEEPVELAGTDDPLDGIDAERLRLLLREIYTAPGGTHDDFGAYDEAMAADRRVAVPVTPAGLPLVIAAQPAPAPSRSQWPG